MWVVDSFDGNGAVFTLNLAGNTAAADFGIHQFSLHIFVHAKDCSGSVNAVFQEDGVCFDFFRHSKQAHKGMYAVNAYIHKRTVGKDGVKCVFHNSGFELVIARRILAEMEAGPADGSQFGKMFCQGLVAGRKDAADGFQ